MVARWLAHVYSRLTQSLHMLLEEQCEFADAVRQDATDCNTFSPRGGVRAPDRWEVKLGQNTSQVPRFARLGAGQLDRLTRQAKHGSRRAESTHVAWRVTGALQYTRCPLGMTSVTDGVVRIRSRSLQSQIPNPKSAIQLSIANRHRPVSIRTLMNAPNFRLDGKVALFTGAGRGIGLGMAQAFAAVGCAVAIQDIDLNVAQAAVDEINRAGGKAVALGGDVTDLSLAPRLIAEVSEKLGGFHVLVNNAAIQKALPWEEFPVEDMRRILDADIISPITFIQQSLPIFRKQKYGRIINIGSVQARGQFNKMMPYAIAKIGLQWVTHALAKDLAEHNITINLIAPGWFDTYRNRNDFEDEQDKVEKGKRVPLGRVGKPADCAGAALMLASDAGQYITGQTLYIDGGLSAVGRIVTS